jgi:hypothetical protein
MSGNGSDASCGFLFAQQLSGDAADDGLSRLIKMPDFCKVAWNFLLLAI